MHNITKQNCTYGQTIFFLLSNTKIDYEANNNNATINREVESVTIVQRHSFLYEHGDEHDETQALHQQEKEKIMINLN